MFSELIGENKIPPNFLNSILTNASLYEMFKNDYEKNKDYFHGRAKEEYIEGIREFIEKRFFSKNIFNIYDENDKEEIIKNSDFIKRVKIFFDDFLLDNFKNNKVNIFENKFFKSIDFAKNNDNYAHKSEEFLAFYEYVFKEAIDYEKEKMNLIEPIVKELEEKEKVSISDFDKLCNYVKNSNEEIINIDIILFMIKGHAFKTNHIFEREVVEVLFNSIAHDYFKDMNISPKIIFTHDIDNNKEMSRIDIKSLEIYINTILVDTFLVGNYVELFSELFFSMDLLKSYYLLENKVISYEALKIIMQLLVHKVDITRIWIEPNYTPYYFYTDLKSSAFVKALKFFQSIGIDLFLSYINEKTKNLDYSEAEDCYSLKMGSLEISFQNKFLKLDKAKRAVFFEKYPTISFFYTKEGIRKKTIDLIKSLNTENYSVITDYLFARIIDPYEMIDDIMDLSEYKTNDKMKEEISLKLLKYIYVDTFIYSLNAYIEIESKKNSYNEEELLNDLWIRISCIKDVPLTHYFKDEALFRLEKMKQN